MEGFDDVWPATWPLDPNRMEPLIVTSEFSGDGTSHYVWTMDEADADLAAFRREVRATAKVWICATRQRIR